MSGQNGFQLLSPPLVAALKERGFDSPTEPQEKLLPIVREGKNALLMAPTGTGKTEAAILPILDALVREGEPREKGTKLLYITPLRALNRDMLDRMQWWCKRFDIRLGVRHGDSSQAERTNLSFAPPDILITTPETLQILLVGRRIRQNLAKLRWVVVDEAHELSEDKRGSQLSVGLERLRDVAEKEFQVVGLSATVGSPEKVAQFLVGSGRKCEVVRVPVEKSLSLRVDAPRATGDDKILADSIYSYPEVAARLRTVRELVEKYRSVLVFTNTRSEAEALSSRFRVWDPSFPIAVHHSSLSKATREAVEKGLKEGKLLGVICTSSLELGIDIGFLEYVVQYNSPRQVTRLIQRVGRSGHRIGQVSNGLVITQDSDDTLEAAVLCRKSVMGELEPLEPVFNPYDVAIHQVAGLLIEQTSWNFDDLMALFRRSYAYADLDAERLKKVLVYMRERYPRLAYYSESDGKVFRARDIKPLFSYYFDNLSMIPDEKQYLVIEGDNFVGTLDEAFVSEYGEVGVKFVEAGRCWKVEQIYGNKVYVKAEEDPTGAVPNWVGDEIPVPREVAAEVGAVRRRYAEELSKGTESKYLDELVRTYPVSRAVLEESLKEVAEQYEAKLPIPSERLITIEKWDRFLVIQAAFGHRVNRLLARVIGHIVSERIGQSVAVHQDPYRIVIEADVSPATVLSVIEELHKLDLGVATEKAVERSGIFKRRLIHAGKKCGAIAKDADYASVSISGIIEALRDTPVYEEAMSVIFHDDFDLAGASDVVEKIHAGAIEVKPVEYEALTPIARIGVEEISRRGEIVSPERLRALLKQSTRARINETFLVAVCTNCWNFLELRKVVDLEGLDRCPACGKAAIGLSTDSYENVFSLAMKARSRSDLRGSKQKLVESLRKSSELRAEYGHAVDILVAGRGIRLADASALAAKMRKEGSDVIELAIEGEREALRRRYFFAAS
ncbi:MAG: DEAD/DEAH box helicase [Nitrososphaerota archaeon]|nr:DEAD/DEAH box helicase [Nitrososphaerota archaeon]MDG6975515.1 DEAD/DEAH box helicase [Nitrososphaerota archaeon]MDG7009914.1 DEAD/DEAH box helicase [Nitrososphaerota archaeon]